MNVWGDAWGDAWATAWADTGAHPATTAIGSVCILDREIGTVTITDDPPCQ